MSDIRELLIDWKIDCANITRIESLFEEKLSEAKAEIERLKAHYVSPHACEACKDTGYYGDNNAGIKGNNEYVPCDQCTPYARALRSRRDSYKKLETENTRLKSLVRELVRVLKDVENPIYGIKVKHPARNAVIWIQMRDDALAKAKEVTDESTSIL